MLIIKNLWVSVGKKQVLKGVDLVVKPGEVQVVMGPNGSGKSTLAYAVMGHPAYKVTRGSIKMETPSSKISRRADSAVKATWPSGNSQGCVDDITLLTPDQRARVGLFLAFQYPVGVEGVTVEQLLRKLVRNNQMANAKKQTNSQLQIQSSKQINALAFRKYLETEARQLGIKKQLLRRSLNQGFSGGEKKRMEILQLAVLKPRYAILDETDSGLDIDALRMIAGGVSQIAAKGIGVILITHYQRILKFIKLDKVHVMMGGKIVKSGGKELVEELEKEGYKKILNS